ncbi:MAG: ribose-phosphate pyrophosphokinase [candidate division Zixibacteria bacterium]|jgi:ribose-phosphate pyrophosphokinase|nr:ribose-phosphate pyrophosphokinase [candidate division Zixibacteria bacterium]
MLDLKLIAGNSNRPLARKIARYIGAELTACEIKRFSDGEIFVQLNENIRGTDVFIIQSTNAPAENIMELLILIEASRRASASRITAVIPYYGYGRQDRKDRPRVPITAKLVANLITTAGADRVITMDLHAAQIQGFFDIPHDHLYSSRFFNDYLLNHNVQDIVVVSPDVGSIKLARAFAKAFEAGLAIVDKRRPSPNQSEVLNIIGEIAGRNIIIRDDMVDTGGTLCQAAEILAEKGALEILAVCTHPVLSGGAIERINNSVIKKMYISDSINVEEKHLPDKFVVLTCANLFGEAIMRISGEKSVSSLFDD